MQRIGSIVKQINRRNMELETFECSHKTAYPSRDGGGKYTIYVTKEDGTCLLYTSPSPRDATLSRMPSSA